MATNNLGVEVTAGLNKTKSITQINADIKKIEGQIAHLKLTATLNKGASLSQIQQQITDLNRQKKQLYIDLKIRKNDLKQQYRQVQQDLQNQVQPINIPVNTSQAQNQMSGLNNSLKAAHGETVSLASALKKTFENMGLVISAQTALQWVRRAANEATEAVKEYDNYVKNLRIITNTDSGTAKNMLSGYADKSLEMKIDVSEYEKASEVILRAGKNLNESTQYVENAIKLSKAGFIESDKAATNLVTIANAYDLTANELERVNDVLLTLDTSSNTTAGALSEALAKSAKNAQLAGISYQELGSIIAKLKDTTGKTETELANSMNSIFNRTYRVKLGKYILENEDGSTEDITQELSDVEKMLNTVGVSVRNSKKEFKDFGDIMNDLVPVWDKLSSVDKSSIAFVFGGTTRKNDFLTLMDSWADIQTLVQKTADSAGTAESKYNAYLESIEAKAAALSTNMKQLWNNLIPDNTAGNILDTTSALVQFLDKYDILQTALKSVVIYGVAKGFIAVKNSLPETVANVKNFTTAMNLSRQSTALTGTQLTTLGNACKGLSSEQVKLVLSTKNLTNAEKIPFITENRF